MMMHSYNVDTLLSEKGKKLIPCSVHAFCCYVEGTITQRQKGSLSAEAHSLAFDKRMCQQTGSLQLTHGHILR